jgi:hypothetical protein
MIKLKMTQKKIILSHISKMDAGSDEGTQDYYTLDRLFLTEYVERRNNQNNLE